jgi:D-serine deaminase-like pyridoxal phosphate-dependent protein
VPDAEHQRPERATAADAEHQRPERATAADAEHQRLARATVPDAEHQHLERATAADAEHQRLERATAELQAPFALVDLDAFWANAGDMRRRAAPKPIRLASKSLRCRHLQERVLATEGFRGTLAFTLPEALWLASHGVEDLLVAYPSTDRIALRELAHSGAPVTVMVDDVEQLELIEAAVGPAPNARVGVCIDVDASWWLASGRGRVGVKRSPVHTLAQTIELARSILSRERLRLVGVMAYEAQIAGLGDAPPGRPLRGRAIRAMQARSARELAKRRAEIVAAVRVLASGAGAPLELVNGGGTGSLELTASDPYVSEVTAGSGLYGPWLFDSYSRFAPRPAAMFALPVVRPPPRDVVTALGGGYVASGPAEPSRLPQPHLPAGLRLDRQEGAGEVQTPMLGAVADSLAVGDRVYMRHAKAGELCERFASLHLIEGDRVVDEVPTYRGEGKCFL